jgi:RNA polymerase sigma-70 factor (ECF subfamily)
MYRVARNLVYEQEARRLPAGRLAKEGELEALEDSHDGPDIVAHRSGVAEELNRVIAELPPRHQAILLLFCQNGLSQREIADQIGLSKSMVQKCLAQGIAHCRKRLRSLRDGPVRAKGGGS